MVSKFNLFLVFFGKLIFFFFFFLDLPTSIYGNSLKKQVEDRLKFYESGEAPRKNIDVMKEAMELAGQEAQAIAAEEKKKKKKKKRKAEALDETLNGTNGNSTLGLDATNGEPEENGEPKKKKKKKKKNNDE